jgi:hypothetical protein
VPRIIKNYFIAILMLFCFGCSTSSGRDSNTVSIVNYNIAFAHENLEFLHNANINNLEKYKELQESTLSLDVLILWAGIYTPGTSQEEKERTYRTLRLIAVQNEKVPIKSINSNPEVVSILNNAIQNDQEHTKYLRCQDWTKPKWVGKSCEEK